MLQLDSEASLKISKPDQEKKDIIKFMDLTLLADFIYLFFVSLLFQRLKMLSSETSWNVASKLTS